MRRVLPAAVLLLPVLACQSQPPGSGAVSLETSDERASYAIGVDIGNSLAATGDHVQIDQLLAGLMDVRAGREIRLEDADMRSAMMEFQTAVRAEQEAEQAEQAQRNQEEGEAYMAENANTDGVITTESGLQVQVLREGDGASPTREDQVVVHYRGTLIDGTEFDSSYDGEPATFAAGRLIPGFTEALLMMKVGSHVRAVIPGNLAYGPNGSPPDIGPNATLIFEIELLDIV